MGMLSFGQPAASVKESMVFVSSSTSKEGERAEAAEEAFCSFHKYAQHWFWKGKPGFGLQNHRQVTDARMG